MFRTSSLAFSVVLCALWAGACATTTYSGQPKSDHRVAGAFEQPLKDLSWMREDPPELLKRAVEKPYDVPVGQDCDAITEEIAALDVLLGPDVDAPGVREREAIIDPLGLIAGAIGGVVGLPYRGIVRKLSGASEREKVLRDAIFAGTVRRAFLKGVARSAGCVVLAGP